MGLRGPVPKPTQLRLIDGARDDKINHDAPVPRDALPQPPDDLPDDVREIWDYTVRELDYMSILKAVDRDALVPYCHAVINHRNASEKVRAGGILIKGIKGGLVRNPALAVQRDAANVIRMFAQEFGLTPSARTRIEVREAEDAADNPFAASG